MQYLLYCVVYFKFQSTTKEVFATNVVDRSLANRGVFKQQYAHDAKIGPSI